ncbi:hypothetical protein STURO_v1c06600 [Spiroplasma turonicum]|nr:hypothetical protein STURO_v1c06600 [Spiroplasma turonicum]
MYYSYNLFNFYINKIGLRMSKASANREIEERSAALKDIIWALIGAGLVFIAGSTAGVFAAIFFS